MKLKKILAIGIAAIITVSAMTVNVLACENPEDAVVSLLAADGVNYIYLSQDDIDNGNTTLTGYRGITLNVIEEDNIAVNRFSQMNMRISAGYTRTSAPAATASIEDASYSASYSVSQGASRFSDHLLLNKSKSNVFMRATVGADYENEVKVDLYKSPSQRLIQMSLRGINPRAINVTGVPVNSQLYAHIQNTWTGTASGTLEISGY